MRSEDKTDIVMTDSAADVENKLLHLSESSDRNNKVSAKRNLCQNNIVIIQPCPQMVLSHLLYHTLQLAPL